MFYLDVDPKGAVKLQLPFRTAKQIGSGRAGIREQAADWRLQGKIFPHRRRLVLDSGDNRYADRDKCLALLLLVVTQIAGSKQTIVR